MGAAIAAVTAIAVGVAVPPAAGAPWKLDDSPGTGRPGRQSKPPTPEQRAATVQAAAWEAFYAGKGKEAAGKVAALGKAQNSRIRAEAMHCAARIRWAGRTRSSQARARMLWGALGATRDKWLTRVNVQRGAIAKALQARADKQNDQAVKLLEGVLAADVGHTCTAEAAIELARLQAHAGQFDTAARTLDKALAALAARLKDITSDQERTLIGTQNRPFEAELKRAKNNLKFLRDEGRREFEQALGLEKKEKFTEAAAIFTHVTRKYPRSDYAPRSDLHIGYCLLGLKRTSAALEHWAKFVKGDPIGAWRGQAYAQLIRIHLEQLLDMRSAAKHAGHAVSAMPTALKDPGTAASWKPAAMDVNYYVGLTAFIRGDSVTAARHFERAAASMGSRADKSGLRALLAFARSGRPITPEEVRGKAVNLSKAVMTISIARLHQIRGRHEEAIELIERVEKGRAGPVSLPQNAYARFVRGRSLEACGRMPEARLAYIVSLQKYPNGAWHDQTLYHLATIVQTEAAAKFGKPVKPPADKTKPGEKPRKPSRAEKKKLAEAETRRLANLKKARAAALPHWRELTKRYPESPYCEVAAYRAGILLGEVEQWRPAAQMLEGLTENHPQSIFAGDACVRLIDIQLERLFDLQAALDHTDAAVAWASPKAHTRGRLPREVPVPDAKTIRQTTYDLHLRAGLVAYLNQDYDKAIKMFQAAKPHAPPRGFKVVSGKIPTGIERMTAAVKAGKRLTPDEVLNGDQKARLILQLADVYHFVEDYDKSVALCRHVIDSPGKASRQQQSWALFRRGRSLFCMDWKTRDPLAAMKNYLAAQRLAPKTPWAYHCLFLSGNIAFNTEHKVNDAVQLWRRLIARYPKCREAQRAAYYIGVAYEVDNRPSEAIAAFEVLVKAYPESSFVKLARKHQDRLRKTMQRPRDKEKGVIEGQNKDKEVER